MFSKSSNNRLKYSYSISLLLNGHGNYISTMLNDIYYNNTTIIEKSNVTKTSTKRFISQTQDYIFNKKLLIFFFCIRNIKQHLLNILQIINAQTPNILLRYKVHINLLLTRLVYMFWNIFKKKRSFLKEILLKRLMYYVRTSYLHNI